MFLLLAADERPEGPLSHVYRAAVVPASREETVAFFSNRRDALPRLSI